MEDDNNTASKLIEIKEILDNPKILMLSYGNYISLNDYVKLKDYITNLQQENAELKKKNDSLGETNLRINGDLKVAKQDRIEYSNELEDYKSRCEKAVEYINNCPEYLWANVNTKVLLNILSDRSDE